MQATSWQRGAFALQQIAIIRQVLSIVNKYILYFDKDTWPEETGTACLRFLSRLAKAGLGIVPFRRTLFHLSPYTFKQTGRLPTAGERV